MQHQFTENEPTWRYLHAMVRFILRIIVGGRRIIPLPSVTHKKTPALKTGQALKQVFLTTIGASLNVVSMVFDEAEATSVGGR
ncbi:hypothetical protein [Scandinavium goeteborgense]|uniref:hypothetical protein n=1 Tax=Scandinavium goeteborgense TaxID=1851514 RepID=UPI001414D49E|nr:hypothetical protein [Scandinavium goeteborgense]